MSKTVAPTAAELLQAEMAALVQADAERAQRVRRIEALQLPVGAEALSILRTKSVTEAANLLPPLAASLTDNMQSVLTNLAHQITYAVNVMESETARIQGQIDADAKAVADAQAEGQ